MANYIAIIAVWAVVSRYCKCSWQIEGNKSKILIVFTVYIPHKSLHTLAMKLYKAMNHWITESILIVSK